MGGWAQPLQPGSMSYRPTVIVESVSDHRMGRKISSEFAGSTYGVGWGLGLLPTHWSSALILTSVAQVG